MEHTRTVTPPGPRTAAIWAALRGELDRHAGRSLAIIDVGGGTGGFAVPLAQAGHRVTVLDASPDALASLDRRAADAGVSDLIRGIQGDADQVAALVEPGDADIALCHSVLESVDNPTEVLAGVAAALRRGGLASLVVANRRGAVLARAIAGQLASATAMLAGDATPADPAPGGPPTRRRANHRFDADEAAALARSAGLTVESVAGVRIAVDLLGGAPETPAAELLEFELAASREPGFRDIATQLHVLARR